MKPRFEVVTVSGFRADIRRGGSATPGLSAHVVDSIYNYRIVASFRSEDSLAIQGADGRFDGTYRLGIKGARRRAEALAEDLNRAADLR